MSQIHVQIRYLESLGWYINSNCNVIGVSIDTISAPVEVKAWYRVGDKPLDRPTANPSHNAYASPGIPHLRWTLLSRVPWLNMPDSGSMGYLRGLVYIKPIRIFPFSVLEQCFNKWYAFVIYIFYDFILDQHELERIPTLLWIIAHTRDHRINFICISVRYVYAYFICIWEISNTYVRSCTC